MTYLGTVKNGVVVLPPNADLPDGMSVDVTPRLVGSAIDESTAGQDAFVALVEKIAKPRPHLPADYALNHGHYVGGEPKK